MLKNQYGRPGRAAQGWGETIEGSLPEEELQSKLHDQNVENLAHRFLDEEYYASRDYNMADIEVPLLSVANWGGQSNLCFDTIFFSLKRYRHPASSSGQC